jgi:Outer membrane protein beta-barrel domain
MQMFKNLMKQFSIVLLFIIASSFITIAQTGTFSLNVTGGYTFKDRVNLDTAYADVSEGFLYGGSLEYFPNIKSSLELSYQRIGVDFPLYKANGDKISSGDESGNVNYILVGANAYFFKTQDARFRPFLGGGIGVGILNGSGETSTKFAWNIKTGVKIKTSTAISFKLNAYLNTVVSSLGTEHWETMYGVVVGPSYAHLLQFGLGGAICFDFPKKK